MVTPTPGLQSLFTALLTTCAQWLFSCCADPRAGIDPTPISGNLRVSAERSQCCAQSLTRSIERWLFQQLSLSCRALLQQGLDMIRTCKALLGHLCPNNRSEQQSASRCQGISKVLVINMPRPRPGQRGVNSDLGAMGSTDCVALKDTCCFYPYLILWLDKCSADSIRIKLTALFIQAHGEFPGSAGAGALGVRKQHGDHILLSPLVMSKQ